MNEPWSTPLSDEALDRELQTFLASEAADIGAAPTAAEMTLRIAHRVSPGPRAARRRTGATSSLRMVVLLGLLALLLVVLAVIAGQHRNEAPRLLGAGEILVEQRAYDSTTGDSKDAVCPDCGYMHDPAWSADVTRLAYLGDELSIVDTRTQTIDKLGVCRSCASSDAGLRSYISLAANGSMIAYVEDGQVQIIDVATRAVRRLTRLPAGQSANGPTLSPDGRQVAFVISGQPGLWVVATDGGLPRQLVPDDSTFDPAWSPDGSTIAYVRDGDDLTYQLWLYDVVTGTSRKIWQDPGCCISDWGGPGWSPDGTSIAVIATDPSHSFGLFVVDVASGQSRQLVDTVAVSRPAWRPVVVEPRTSPSDMAVGDATSASPTAPVSACGSVNMHPESALVPAGPWDVARLSGGIAVGVPDQMDNATKVLYIAGGQPAALTGLALGASDDVVVSIQPLAATPSGSVIVQVTATSQRWPLSTCSDLWRITATDGVPVATRLTTHVGGQTMTWESVSPSGRRVAYVLDDTTGDGVVKHLSVLDTSGAGGSVAIGDPPCASDRYGLKVAAWSPAEDTIAVACTDRLELIDVVTGLHRELPIPASTTISALTWRAADGSAPAVLLAATSPEGVNGPLTVAAIDPDSGITSTIGTWKAVDGQPLEWLGGMDDSFSPDQRRLWTLGQQGGMTEQGGYVIDLADGAIKRLMTPEERPDLTEWIGADTLGSGIYDDETRTRLQARDPASGVVTDLASVPIGTWKSWVP